MNAKLEKLCRLAIDADKAWQASLERHYGKQASERRYDWDKSSHPRECRVLHGKWREAWGEYQFQLGRF